MTPRVSILQLDTRFPRIAGDVAAETTYTTSPEIIRIHGAGVEQIVTQNPASVDITPFVEAARKAKGDVITTSCGFLAPFEDLLAKEVDRPFLASSLNALPCLSKKISSAQIQILTFDADRLCAAHFSGLSAARVVGLRPDSHLRQVIQSDALHLDPELACHEMLDGLRDDISDTCRLIVLECTNLPPYKSAIQTELGLKTFDILDRIEATCSGAIRSQHLSPS